jgi:hypothetical protein
MTSISFLQDINTKPFELLRITGSIETESDYYNLLCYKFRLKPPHLSFADVEVYGKQSQHT